MVVQVREMAAKMAAEKQAQQAAEAAAHAERQAGTAPPHWCDLSQDAEQDLMCPTVRVQ